MSPNMMLARTRPLPIQQGPFSPSYFKPQQRWPPRAPRSRSYLRSRGFAALPPCCNLNYFGETVLYVTIIRQSITVYAQSAPRAAGGIAFHRLAAIVRVEEIGQRLGNHPFGTALLFGGSDANVSDTHINKAAFFQPFFNAGAEGIK